MPTQERDEKMSNVPAMDYNYLGSCEYGVSSHDENQLTDCGEYAIVKVWWKAQDVDAMLLCPDHFEKVLNDERIVIEQAEQERP